MREKHSRALPQQRHAVSGKVWIACNNGKPFHLRLCDDEPIKRIAMMPGQRNQSPIMREGWRQHSEAVCIQHTGEDDIEADLELKLAERKLDCHLPRHCMADEPL